MTKLKRKQIYLDEENDRDLKRLSIFTKISEAEHVRRAVRGYIAKMKTEIAEDDPLLELIGMCNGPEGPQDASTNHDRYLYGKKTP